jgi:hypothetical protein
MTFKLPSAYGNQEDFLLLQRSGFSPQGTPPCSRRNRVVGRARARAITIAIICDALELLAEHDDKKGNDGTVKEQ